MVAHSHAGGEASKNLVWSIGFNVIIVIAEVIFGIVARSIALLSEALHNFTDVGSMSLSLWGEKLADRPQTGKKTYGYKRAEIIIAFVNGGLLLGISGWVLVESTIRLFHPETVAGFTMMVVAIFSLLGNSLAAYLLHSGADKNLNLKSAWLHSFQDALFSLGVVVAAIIIYYTGWNWIDPAVSITISIFLLKEVSKILSESINILLDSVPEDLDFKEIKKALTGTGEIVAVSDLHIWQTGSHNRFLSAHLTVGAASEKDKIKILAQATKLLQEKYNIYHITLQIVLAQEIKEIGLVCEHCN